MNQQDSASRSQEWTPSEPRPLDTDTDEPQRPITRPLNTDPREQDAQFSRPIFNADPREQPQPFYQPQPMPPARRRRPWLWVLAVLVALSVLFGAFAAIVSALYRTVIESKTFAVNGIPTLVMQVPSGSVHIESGLPGQISVVASKHVLLGNAALVQVHYAQSGSTITITADQQGALGLFSNNYVEFDVSVPSQSNLSITANSGSLQANGIIGTIQLHASSGSIQADNLAGALTLITASGSITGGNLKGQMTLRASSGSITISAVSATNNSSFQTQSGSIDFQGTLVPAGTFLFGVQSGSVDLTLPQNVSFHVDASTHSGSIDTDFSEVQVQRGTSGAEAHGTVGSPPLSTIIIQAESGSISLHQE
jgi:hypothetical protein